MGGVEDCQTYGVWVGERLGKSPAFNGLLGGSSNSPRGSVSFLPAVIAIGDSREQVRLFLCKLRLLAVPVRRPQRTGQAQGKTPNHKETNQEREKS